MIRPQSNAHREAIDLSGVWRIRMGGEGDDWSGGIDADALAIAVPGSWNEQLAEAGWMNHVGDGWYETPLFVPARAMHGRVALRFGSADYEAEAWIDGAHAGRSGPAMLPFELDVTGLVRPGATHRLVVRVSNLLPESGPTQRVSQADYVAEGRRKDEYLPAVRFDFFPYGGLNRAVHLVLTPEQAFTDVRVVTHLAPRSTPVQAGPVPTGSPSAEAGQGTRGPRQGQTDRGGVRVALKARGGASVRARVVGHGIETTADAPLVDSGAELALDLDPCRLWSPADPALYDLTLELLDADGTPRDKIRQRVGIREVRVDGARLLLNGESITLRGFGKHEDSPVHGRGVNLPLLVKDFGLLGWVGANSARTSHYPYDEAFLDMADERGLLVISELFSINLDFLRVDDATLAAHKAAASALIARDGSRPSVIAWSLSNEPGYLGEPEYRERSGAYWAELFGHARALDATRPFTHANVQYAGNDDPAFHYSDIVTVNRYHGWYSEPGQIARGATRFRDDLDAVAVHGKPVFVAEFGADGVAGWHATHDQMWTEEYQADLIAAYWQVIEDHPACIGGHVWNFADFRTAQHHRRAVLNHKGVFTRTRDPKAAAWRLRGLWGGA